MVVKVPESQRDLYGEDWTLLPADSMWALLLWYRLHCEIQAHGKVQDVEEKFIVLSHTTSDCITLLAKKYNLGVVRTWVGFASLSAAVRDVWERKERRPLRDGRETSNDQLCDSIVCDASGMTERRCNNVGAFEQSNGFSILGSPPPDERSLGRNGYVRDKDGTLAALLVAEVMDCRAISHERII